MPRKNKMIDTHRPEEDDDLGPSRTKKRRERKREASEVEELVLRLEALPDRALVELGLDEGVVAALRELRLVPPSDARGRQIRFLARMVRPLDRVALGEAVGRITGTSDAAAARLQTLERWRERLLTEGDAALDALLAAYPGGDRQTLRQAVRAATKEREAGAGGRKARELFKQLRALDRQAESPLRAAASVDTDHDDD